MALVQMRTPGGSYSMVDEKLVSVYEAEGWVLTSDLPEFKTKDVTYYDEARKTVTTTSGEEKPVEEVISEPTLPKKDLAPGVTTLSDRAQQNRNYTDAEWKALVNAPIEQKLEMIKNNAANGLRLTSSQKYYLDKNFGQINSSDINTAQTEGKQAIQKPGATGPLQPGQAGYGIDTWYEFLGYGSEDEAMLDFQNGKLTPAQIRRAEAEVQPDPADVLVDITKVKTTYGVAESDWARATPSGQKYLSLLETINALENSMFGSTPPGQAIINDLKSGTSNDITVSGGGTGNPNLGSGTSADEVSTDGEEIIIDDDGEPGDGGGDGGDNGGTNQLQQPPQGGIQLVDLLNAPDGAYVWNVDGNLYVAYEVPGSRGEVYDGPPLFMAYEVPGNDLVAAGLWSPEAPPPFISQLLKEDFDAITILQSGNTDQLTSLIDHPFASFAEQLETQIAVAPWLADIEAVGLLAEAALEGRQVSEAEWQGTTWWKEHSESERNWLVTYNSDPSTAQQLTTDAQLAVANSLQAAGVSNAPEAIVNWIADKYVSGQWSQTYTTEQISLFADPYATGKRDENFENYLSSTAITGVDRTTEREREVRELYSKWLGPSLGKLTDKETAEIAGRLRDDPDYQDQLIQSLKQSRLAAFSNYTNPELTYEDIARPWRNLTTSVWGQTADETQGWWQEMMKSNDYAKAQNTLREKGLEQDITQVTQDATKALQQALGQGTVSQLGVNV